MTRARIRVLMEGEAAWTLPELEVLAGFFGRTVSEVIRLADPQGSLQRVLVVVESPDPSVTRFADDYAVAAEDDVLEPGLEDGQGFEGR